MTIHPRDLASRIAATQAIIDEIEASSDPERSSQPASDQELQSVPETPPEPAAEPTLPVRRDGWTPEKQAEFLRQLASTHNVAEAARAVGMTRQSAYKLRNRLKGEPFDIAWAAAFRRKYDALAEAALERALGGVEVPHFYKGELIHVSRRYDERLTVALLALRDRLAPLPHCPRHEQERFAPDDFKGLVARVETGAERWRRE